MVSVSQAQVAQKSQDSTMARWESDHDAGIGRVEKISRDFMTLVVSTPIQSWSFGELVHLQPEMLGFGPGLIAQVRGVGGAGEDTVLILRFACAQEKLAHQWTELHPDLIPI